MRRFSTIGSLRSAVDTIKVQPPAVHTPPPPPPPVIKVKKSVGAVRGGFTGFLLGCVVTGTLGYSTIMGDYQTSNALILESLDELQKSTTRIKQLALRVEELERRRPDSKPVDELRNEMHTLLNKMRIEQLSK